MEEAFKAGGLLDKPPAKSPNSLAKDPSAPPLKREDIDIIVSDEVLRLVISMLTYDV